jgi:hypothetical protein
MVKYASQLMKECQLLKNDVTYNQLIAD